jgi:hypothetical protein
MRFEVSSRQLYNINESSVFVFTSLGIMSGGEVVMTNRKGWNLKYCAHCSLRLCLKEKPQPPVHLRPCIGTATIRSPT